MTGIDGGAGDHVDRVSGGELCLALRGPRSSRTGMEREIQLSALRGALGAGEASGEAQEFDFDAFIATRTA